MSDIKEEAGGGISACEAKSGVALLKSLAIGRDSLFQPKVLTSRVFLFLALTGEETLGRKSLENDATVADFKA